jgi:hypothetical protein
MPVGYWRGAGLHELSKGLPGEVFDVVAGDWHKIIESAWPCISALKMKIKSDSKWKKMRRGEERLSLRSGAAFCTFGFLGAP